jgi:integrase
MSIHFDRKNGCWRFQFDRYIAGQRKRSSQLLPKGWTRAKADKFDLQETARIYAVETGVTPKRHLIEDAVLLYLKHHAPALQSFKNIRRELWAFSEAYTGRALSELSEVAQEYARAQAGVLAPATVRNRLAYLRAACIYAWKRHKFGDPGANPAARMSVPRVNNARHFYWSRAQFLAVCRKMPSGAKRAAVRIAFYSGMRSGEVVKAGVAGDGALFDLGMTKNGLPRLVPVHPRLAHILRNPDLWPAKHTKWTISKEFKKAARLAGLPQAVLHDMRHSTASEMARGGADLYTIGGVLGHKSTVTTQRYTHLVTEHLKTAVGLVGRKSPTKDRPKAAANG